MSTDSYRERKDIRCKSEKPCSIWYHFGVLFLNNQQATNDDGKYCKFCEQRYSSNTSSSTLKRHLLNQHKIDLKDESAAKKSTSQIFNSSYQPSSKTEKKSLLGRRLGMVMCRDLRPASVFTTPGFHDLMEQLSGGNLGPDDFPSRGTIDGAALDDIYLNGRTRLLEVLQNAPKIITVTSDNWTDAAANTPYANVGLQFIDDELNFHHYHLSTESFPRPHDAKRQAQKIEEILMDFHLSNRTFWFVGDR